MKKSLLFLTAAFIFFTQIPSKVFCQSSNFDGLSQSQLRVYRENFVKMAEGLKGSSYAKGKRGPSTFDEAGFVHFCAQTELELILPATVRGLYDFAQIVSDSEREIGDLVFFKNEGNSITEIGIYTGNSSFLACTKTAGKVDKFSLKDSTWKKNYAGTGKLVPYSAMSDTPVKTTASSSSKKNKKEAKASKSSNNDSEEDSDSASASEGSPSGSSKSSGSSKNKSKTSSSKSKSSSGSLSEKIFVSASLTGDWSLFTEKRFMPNFRGLTAFSLIDYQGENVTPGGGFALRWNNGTGMFQIPVIFSLKANEYLRFYAGPVFSVGNGHAPDTSREVKASIFPGIAGMSIYFPSFTSGDLKVQIMQDINYTFFNKSDGSVMNPLQSLSSGFELSTGVTVTLPLSMFI